MARDPRGEGAGEIELIREAIKLTDAAYMAMREWLKPGVTEAEAAWVLNRHMFDHGAEATAFTTILGAGEGSVIPHHEPTHYPIEPGEPCWVDSARSSAATAPI